MHVSGQLTFICRFTPQSQSPSITPTYGDLYYEFSSSHNYDGVLPQ